MTRIIGISSGKGGVGKTTVTANLALSLKKMGKRVLMIDCNLSTPHLSYYLGVTDYNSTLNDVIKRRVSSSNALYNYDGVWFLPASLRLKDLAGLDLRSFRKAIGKIADPDKFDYVLLDSAPGLGRESICVLNAADEILFVTTPFVPMVNDVLRSIEVLKQLGRKKVGIVLNMANEKKYEIYADTIERLIGIPVVGSIPTDSSIVHGLVLGDPIVKFDPMSDASISFMRLAATLSDEEYEPPNSIRRFANKITKPFRHRSIRMMQDMEDLESEIYLQEGQKNQELKKDVSH